MPATGGTAGAEARDGASATVYCIVPRRLSRIRPRLCEHFADDPQVEVVVDPESALQRRLRPGLESGRLWDPLGTTAPLEQPPLPAELRAFADELVFVRSAPRAEAEAEFARAAREWRERHHEADEEARELARDLIAEIERARRQVALRPRPLIAVLRVQHALDRRSRRDRR